MGMSVNAELSYGIYIDYTELPWCNDKYDDIEDWWLDVNNFINPIEFPYTEDGNYKEGFYSGHPSINKYFENIRNFHKENPVPIKIVYDGNYDSEVHILTTKTMRAYWGELQDVDPDFFNDVQESHDKLIDFLGKYGIITDQQPRWILSAYMS